MPRVSQLLIATDCRQLREPLPERWYLASMVILSSGPISAVIWRAQFVCDDRSQLHNLSVVGSVAVVKHPYPTSRV